MKRFLAVILIIGCLSALVTACNFSSEAETTETTETTVATEPPLAKEQEFYDLVSITQDTIDTVADDIYRYWYDCIYNKKYYNSIDLAILTAQADNADNLKLIEENTTKIKELYTQVRDGKLHDEVKAVMQAYNKYYSLVLEVSGSFSTYSKDKETLKKSLSSALKDLYFEI